MIRPDDVLVLRTTAYSLNGTPIVLPDAGPFEVDVSPPDTHPLSGAHGFAWAQMSPYLGQLLCRGGPVWQVLAVQPQNVVFDHGRRRVGKCRAGVGEVVYTGDRPGAIALMAEHAPKGMPLPWAYCVETGPDGIAIAGDFGCAVGRWKAVAGYRGFARALPGGRAAAGEGGEITVSCSRRGYVERTFKVGQAIDPREGAPIGVDRIEPGRLYSLQDNGAPVAGPLLWRHAGVFHVQGGEAPMPLVAA